MTDLRDLLYKRTTSRDLILALSAIISCIFSLIGIGAYGFLTWQARQNLTDQATALTQEFAEVLATPLYHLNTEVVQQIGQTFLRTDHLEGLRIEDNYGQLIFEYAPPLTGVPLRREQKIFKDQEYVGHILATFTDTHITRLQVNLIYGMLALMTTLIAILILSVNTVLKFLLERPLQQFIQGLRIIASGRYDHPLPLAPQHDLAAISAEVNLMAAHIANRTHELQHEILERMRAEKALQQLNEVLSQSEQKYRSIFEHALEGIFQVSPDGRFLSANPALAHMFGYDSPEELIEQPLTALRIRSKELIACYQALERDGSVYNYEFGYVLHNERMMWGSLSAHAVRDATHKILYYEGILVNITERKQKEQAERERQTAEASNRAKSIFLANMSHELRTPLNAILGFAQILSHNPHSPEAHEHLAVIIRSGEHLLTLINQVLDLAKIEAGRVTLNEQEVDLFDLLDEVYRLFDLNAQEKQLQFAIIRASDLPRTIRTDEVKLRQILINLIGNAVKFTETGSITVRVWTPRTLIGGTEATDLRLIFEVEDTGPGMTPEEVDTLFTLFTQTRTGQQSKEGTGLGLVISQQFVHVLGGDIRVNSVVGRGTTFSFAVQVGAVTSPGSRTGHIQRRVIALEPDQPAYRLLIVDDDPDNRRVLVTFLQPVGFELREACNGQEALAIWQQWQPHLIWLDLRMPDMRGYDVAQTIRAAEDEKQKAAEKRADGQEAQHHISDIKHTIIIVISATGVEDERQAALSHGCDDFLRKPFREHDMFDLLRTHLDVRFVYADEHKSPDADQSLPPRVNLTPEHLAALSDDVRQELRNAVERLEVDTTLHLLDRIRPQHAAVAETIAELVRQYRFDALQACFHSSELSS